MMKGAMIMNATDELMRKTIMSAYDYVCRDPEKNLPGLLEKLIRMDPAGIALRHQATDFLNTYNNPNGVPRQLVQSFFTDVDDNVRRKLFENIVVNGTLIGSPLRKKLAEKHDCNIPWLMVLDPTTACNLHCTGCWAADYGHTMNLTVDELDDVINQGTEIGCYDYMFAGGEPMMRKDDILELCRRHQDCEFMIFTNGTLIDEEFADKMLEVANLVPAISIEGYEEDTDFRRGAGTFRQVIKAMNILHERKLAFGASSCYTRKSAELIGSEEYFDFIIGLGCKFMWCFSYTPVGVDAATELIITAEQRKMMYYNIRKFRTTKPLFAVDFYNDAKYVDGCIAGGRAYLHINANGDIEPCAFLHYSDSNIRKDKILDAMQKPLFKAFHDNEPFNKNMLRPCPLVDNPGMLPMMVKQSGAKSTDMMAPEDPMSLSQKCVPLAREWEPIARELWNEEQKQNKQ